MFGTIVTNPARLTRAQRARYSEVYCGLCHQLGLQYGSAGSATLTFDMTFLAMLLASLYRLEETPGNGHCARHPLKNQPYVTTAATAYAAELNLVLAYYQRLDDWQDDQDAAALHKARQLEAFLPGIRQNQSRQCQAITQCLTQLSEMEKENELNPDLPANCFGELMGSLFVWRQDAYAEPLFRMGAALGRFVYLLDAANDLRADIKKQRYNPLMAQLDTDFTPVLTLMMAECTAEFEQLPIRQDLPILQNVLYSGVWQHYRPRRKEGPR